MKKSEIEYNQLLKSGMFYEFYPQLTGIYEQDKKEWEKIYKDLIKNRKKYKNSIK